MLFSSNPAVGMATGDTTLDSKRVRSQVNKAANSVATIKATTPNLQRTTKMTDCRQLILVFISCLSLLHFAATYETELVTTIEAGKVDCFFVPAQKAQTLEIEYQVIDGDQGDLDIDFTISSPTSQFLVAESRKSDNAHKVQIEIDGDYKICFDNSRSMFNSKTVFFEIELGNDDDEGKDIWGDDDKNYYAGLQAEEVYEIQIQDIKDSIAKVRGQLLHAQQLQDTLRAFEARDRNVAESSFSRVNTWSFVQIAAMVATGFIQVFMVRSLFDDKSVAHRLWKRGKL